MVVAAVVVVVVACVVVVVVVVASVVVVVGSVVTSSPPGRPATVKVTFRRLVRERSLPLMSLMLGFVQVFRMFRRSEVPSLAAHIEPSVGPVYARSTPSSVIF